MVAAFLEIARDAEGAGVRVLEEWVSDPKKFLSEDILGIEPLLRGLTPEQLESMKRLVAYFTKTSFYFLFKHLEEGESAFVFALQMKNEETGEVCDLISEGTDLDIRASFV